MGQRFGFPLNPLNVFTFFMSLEKVFADEIPTCTEDGCEGVVKPGRLLMKV
jgi:hypothetical protein